MSNGYNFMNCEVHFGVVPVGTTSVKFFPFKNKHYDTVKFYVTRNNETNPLYHVFDVNKYEGSIKGSEEFNLKISYSPNIPGNKDFDYFTIADTRKNLYNLCFKGRCIGPSVSASIRQLTFYRTPNRTILKKVFVLKNNSTVPALFHIDSTEEKESAFSTEPLRGTLAPHEEEYIAVYFHPSEENLYSRQLVCLILYHEPIIVNLFGICSTTDDYSSSSYKFRFYPFPREETVGFRGFMSDSVTLKLVPPPFSLTENCLDFGRMLPESSCQTLTTSLTNHMDHPITVEWEGTNFFNIYPQKLEIPPKLSALYECRFVPEITESVASAIINGNVSWTMEIKSSEDIMEYEIVNVPIPMVLRLIGHSFPKNQSWIPCISIIPDNVVLPLTLPGFPTWTSFMLEARGHLPVLYKLVPPIKTQFIMKPMVGLVRSFQIIIVQLESASTKPLTYVEKWSIELNGLLEKNTYIYVKAQTDLPKIKVGENNVVRFEPLQPGTIGKIQVPIKNISYCQLEYDFQTLDNFDVDPATAILGPNEEIFLQMWYKSDILEYCIHEQVVDCRVQYIDNENAHVGECYIFPITMITEVVYSELCALPNNYNSGVVEYGSTITTCFYLYNFGESNINFQLSHDHNLSDVVLNPSTAKCGPKQKIFVKVIFTIKNLGKNRLIISYNNRLSSCSCSGELVESEAPINIFWIKYECIFPYLQITDLVEHNYGHIFSNQCLWKLLNIDEINAALVETNQGEIRRISLCVPDCEISDKLFYLVFTIKNISSIYTRLVLKRRQVCDCKQKESNDSFTFRMKIIDCPHKNMLSMSVPNSSMPADMNQTFSFYVKYIFPGKNKLSYIMELSSERTIILNIFLTVISPDNYALSLYKHSYVLRMGYVFIGLREPPVFAVWLYNNSLKDVPFKLDDVEIVTLCNNDDFPVLKCLNCEGFVKAGSLAPILFKFWPIEVKLYKVAVPILLGEISAVIQVEGYGTDQLNKTDFGTLTSGVPYPIQNQMIKLSVDRLRLEPILVSSFTERVFFVSNTSRTQRIQYKWLPCFLNGIVKIEPTVLEGILEPKESHPVLLKITSLNEPCSIEILLCCEYVDYDTLLEKEKNEATFRQRRRSSCKEFTISDTLNIVREDSDVETVEEIPEILHISLPVNVNVVGILDRDNCILPEDQLKQQPFKTVDFDVDKFVKDYLERIKPKERPLHGKVDQEEKEDQPKIIDIEMTKYVMEQIISDAVFSDYFQEIVKSMRSEPTPLYSQIKLDPKRRDEQRAEEIKKLFTQPQKSEVGEIMEELTVETLQAMFHTGQMKKSSMK